MSLGEDENDGDNVCVICYEPLTNTSIGTAVPCGHIFHVDCFGGWAASRHNTRQKSALLPCPLCNGQCSRETPFIRLFLTFDKKHDAQTEDLDDYEDMEDEKVNLTDNSDDNSSTLLQPTDISLIRKYKNHIRTLKETINNLNELRLDLINKEQQLEKQNSESKTQIETLKSELQINQDQHNQTRLDLQEAKVALNRNKASLEKSRELTKLAQDKALHLQRLWKALQDTHQKALHDAHSSSVTEVRELRREHTVLATENQIMKESLAKKSQQIADLHRQLKTLLSKSNEKSEFDIGSNDKDNMIDSKFGSKMSKGHISLLQSNVSTVHNLKVHNTNSTPFSRSIVTTERNVVAIKTNRTPQCSLADQILGTMSNSSSNKHQHTLSKHSLSILNTKKSHTSNYLKRKNPPTKIDNAKSLVPKRSFQNDIRSMFP